MTYTGRLTPSGGHLERGDERAVLTLAGRTLTATLPSGANPWSGVVAVENGVLTADLWDRWGSGLRVRGVHRDGGYDLTAEGLWAPFARIPLVDEAA